MTSTAVDRSGIPSAPNRSAPVAGPARTPLALLRGAATLLPRPLVARLARATVRGLKRTHPTLLANLARLDPGVIQIVPVDLPYRFVLTVGREPVTLDVTDRGGTGANAEIAATVATLIDLLEGRIDSDTLFFRRDVAISGNTSVIVGLRNVLDREELSLADALARTLGPLGPPARAVARRLDRVLDRVGARVAAMHRTLHPQSEAGHDLLSAVERCHSEIHALTARVAQFEARQKRRNEKAG